MLAKHQARDERENLVALLDEADALVKQDESPKAIQIYRQIVNQFSENGFLTSHVAKAKAQLELLGESIAEQAPADRNDKDANETIDDKNSDDDRSGTPPDSK